jgi:hypothetical protein
MRMAEQTSSHPSFLQCKYNKRNRYPVARCIRSHPLLRTSLRIHDDHKELLSNRGCIMDRLQCSVLDFALLIFNEEFVYVKLASTEVLPKLTCPLPLSPRTNPHHNSG